MGISSTVVTARDGGLGIIQSLDGLSAKIGTASAGTADTPVYCATKQAAIDAFTSGPLVRAAIWHFERSQRPLLLVRGTASTAGSAGSVTHVGSGPTVTVTGTPVDTFNVQVLITTGGALGTSQFYYSTDGSTDQDDMIGPIATAATYAIPGTGATLNMAAGTYVVGDTYAFDTVAPANTLANVQTAWDALVAVSTYVWEFCHIVGGGADAAASAALAAALDTRMATAEAAGRPCYVVLDWPGVSGGVTLAGNITAWASTTSTRIVCPVGHHEIAYVDGTTPSVPLGWSIAPKIARTPLSIDIASMDPAEVDRSDLPGVLSIVHDDYVTGGAADAGFLAARTRLGRAGFYVAKSRIKSSPTSDFSKIQYRRIVDQACRLVATALEKYENARIPVDSATGRIKEEKAREIDAHVNHALQAGLVDLLHASSAACSVVRTTDILSTGDLNAEVAVVPPGYGETIRAYVSLRNPAVVAV